MSDVHGRHLCKERKVLDERTSRIFCKLASREVDCGGFQEECSLDESVARQMEDKE